MSVYHGVLCDGCGKLGDDADLRLKTIKVLRKGLVKCGWRCGVGVMVPLEGTVAPIVVCRRHDFCPDCVTDGKDKEDAR